MGRIWEIRPIVCFQAAYFLSISLKIPFHAQHRSPIFLIANQTAFHIRRHRHIHIRTKRIAQTCLQESAGVVHFSLLMEIAQIIGVCAKCGRVAANMLFQFSASVPRQFRANRLAELTTQRRAGLLKAGGTIRHRETHHIFLISWAANIVMANRCIGFQCLLLAGLPCAPRR